MEIYHKENLQKFFVDAMLGNIARKLRLMGYDTRYSANIDDDMLINNAKSEKRIIISRDEKLVRKALKYGVNSILLKNKKEIEQIKEIVNHTKLKIYEITGDRARCPRCNNKTTLIDKININQNIPKKILECNEKFWKCENCNQIFWEGTHIINLQKFVSELNES